MNQADLRSITITDFRSIRGEVTIPLDAPIVLVHGVNGSGKSSVLSAIELALTGSVAGLGAAEQIQSRYLVHRGQPQARVELDYDLEGRKGRAEVSIDEATGSLSGRPALSGQDRTTFLERCYLAQSTVGRLLEMYQHSGSGESALTRFVKDLLGLDTLEAIIDGLFPALDIRRLRHLVPELAVFEDEADRLARRKETIVASVAEIDHEIEEHRLRLVDSLTRALGLDERDRLLQLSLKDLLNVSEPVGLSLEALNSLEATRQELAGLALRAREIPISERLEVESIEAHAIDAERSLEEWQRGTGDALKELLSRLRNLSPDLQADSKSPSMAFRSAQEIVESERKRVDALLKLDEEAVRDIAIAKENVAKIEERIHRLTSQLSDVPDRLIGLSTSLAQLLPHVDGDVCPVCERDFSEVSESSLSDFVASHLASISSEAKRLNQVADALRGARADRAQLLNDIAEAERRQSSPAGRLEARRLQADLAEIGRGLDALEATVHKGDELTQNHRMARETLLAYRHAISQSAEVRQAALRLFAQLGLEVKDTDSLEGLITEALSVASTRIEEAKDLLSLRAHVLELREELEGRIANRSERSGQLSCITVEQRKREGAIREFEARRELAKQLATQAEAERAKVIREVFGHSLNKLWRDLFVRLVPSEPFVPSFRVKAKKGGRITAELETRHRDGGAAGSPSYMLSAGNLNTGAVTLFIALHLSVDPHLPWLILDDPVQSMDEVHIAQFAALLRTLAKRNGRKVVVAVHERSLFDYLALELSPAFPGDKLITVELSRPDGGATQINPQFRLWQEDRALVAV